MHEVAERHADTDSLMDPAVVMNFAAYMARYLAATTQKISLYRRVSVLEALDLAVKRSGTGTQGTSTFQFRRPLFCQGSLGPDIRSLLEKMPIDTSAFASASDGSQLPQLFGGGPYRCTGQ